MRFNSLGAALALWLGGLVSVMAAERPNILFIVGDDMGYADVGFHGCKDIPTPHLDALAAAFPDQPRPFLAKCLNGGDILVNGQPTHARATVTKADKVLIVFGGPKQCYAGTNQAEYWAEGVQDWPTLAKDEVALRLAGAIALQLGRPRSIKAAE